MRIHLPRSFKTGPALREAGDTFPDRTPPTPIRQGRNTPGGMIAAFVLIGIVVVAIALFT